MRCSDGSLYVVKFQNNPQHLRVLTNEMLVSRLAENFAFVTTKHDSAQRSSSGSPKIGRRVGGGGAHVQIAPPCSVVKRRLASAP